MNVKMSRPFGWGRIVSVGLALALFVMAGPVELFAHPDEPGSGNRLEGTWLVQVTLRNCATGASLGSFNSIVTFQAGGSLSETTSSPAFAIGQRSPGHGNWAPQGPHEYGQRMVALINFDTAANLPGTPGFDPSRPVTPGFFAGWSVVTHTVTLTDEDHGTSSGTNGFYKADGTVYRTGCSTAALQRFE